MPAKPDHPAHPDANDCPYGYAHADAVTDPGTDASPDADRDPDSNDAGADSPTEREL